MIPDSTPNSSDAESHETSATPHTPEADSSADEALILDDLLVEEVSIDGMCGVY